MAQTELSWIWVSSCEVLTNHPGYIGSTDATRFPQVWSKESSADMGNLEIDLSEDELDYKVHILDQDGPRAISALDWRFQC